MKTKRLYLGNFTKDTTESELRELLSDFGTVEDIHLIEQSGFGFAQLSSDAEAHSAFLALDGTEFKGRTLRVNEAKPERESLED